MTMLVVGAHSADFVWRAGGAIAVHVQRGGRALVVALSYGERGESGELWKDPNQTEENVKRIRRQQAAEAATILGAEFRCLDLGDYPLVVTPAALDELIGILRTEAPQVILTHSEKDPFNPDHPVAFETVIRARLLASGAGVESAFERITPPAVYSFEPHQPELSGFMPNVFLDITAGFEQKVAAMGVMGAQSYLKDYYTELGGRRGNHARRISGNKSIKQAEAFQRILPQVTDAL